MRPPCIRCFSSSIRRLSTKIPAGTRIPTDELGLPTKPTWSVQGLLSSYPPPTLDAGTLTKLHDLAALHPPAQDSPEFENLRSELGDLIRLVEAVRTAEIGEAEKTTRNGIPDGRIWQEGRCMTFEDREVVADAVKDEPKGQDLLHSGQQTNVFYTVPSSRPPR